MRETQGALPLDPSRALPCTREGSSTLSTPFSIQLVTSAYCVRVFMQGFASADATKGLSDRPLETFGATQVNWFLLKVFS